MSKRPAKRKAAFAASMNLKPSASGDDDGLDVLNEVLANLDLSSPKSTPKVIANALLTLLPDNATEQHASSKKLSKAFGVVATELKLRSKNLARVNQEEGQRLPIAFNFLDEEDGTETVINLPEECFVNMLQFLGGKEVRIF